MNLSKVTMPVVSFITLISLSACAVAGTTDIVKKHFLQQLKMLSLAQSGKSLKKASAKEVLPADSIETYTWVDPSWEIDGASKYSYDQSGRVMQVTSTGWDETRTVYQYDADGKTVRELSISSSEIKAGGVDTFFTAIKFLPGYSNAILASYYGNSAEIDIANISLFASLDSITSIGYSHADDGTIDTSITSTAKYEKVGSNIVRGKMTTFRKNMMESPLTYTYTFYSSGNGVLDTLKAVLVYENDGNSEEVLDPDYTMIISKRNQQGKILEQTTITGLDSNFSDYTIDGKDLFSYNSSGSIDSVVTQEWVDETSGWVNIQKTVYLYNSAAMKADNGTGRLEMVNPIEIDWKCGSLNVIIHDGITVSIVEQLDLQGKVISRTTVTNAKNRIVLNPISKPSTVSLVRLKTDRGDFTRKVSSVK
jgi:hypothetical protein